MYEQTKIQLTALLEVIFYHDFQFVVNLSNLSQCFSSLCPVIRYIVPFCNSTVVDGPSRIYACIILTPFNSTLI